MTSAWAIYLFGNYLRDGDLGDVNFRGFRQLQVLDLGENHLTTIPSGVVDCGKLELLSLARNSQLRELPPELNRLRSLPLLNLTGTNLGSQAIRQANAALPRCEVRV
jgi:Leucine-rich repeat (LRR) protein